MPKEKECLKEFLSRVSKIFPGVFRTDNSVLLCKICYCAISASKIFSVKQHLETAKHKAFVQKKSLFSQTLLTEHQQENNAFPIDLCKMFIAANIPLHKINHPFVKVFFDKYVNESVPSVSNLRLRYVPQIYQNAVNDMRAKANNRRIWISIDETTDVEQRRVVNFVFGVLNNTEDASERERCYLFNVAQVDSANANTMATFVIDSLSSLWPDGVPYENVLLIVTDAAAYMLAAVSALKTLFPKMIHLTCFAHGIHRLSEFIRSQFPAVNKLISSTKAVFLKAPSRRQEFQRALSGIALPPVPCTTRWGSWLKASQYYCEHFEDVKKVVESFDSEEADAIRISKEQFKLTETVNELGYLKCNFLNITSSILKLQERGLSLKTSIEISEKIGKKLNLMENKIFSKKFEAILKRNTDYKTVFDIYNVLFNRVIAKEEYTKLLSPAELDYFSFCPTTSTDVERSFSMYGNLLADNRRKFTFENLKQHLVIYCNYQSMD